MHTQECMYLERSFQQFNTLHNQILYLKMKKTLGPQAPIEKQKYIKAVAFFFVQ